MTELPVAFHDVPADMFPFRVLQFNENTFEVVWQCIVTEPGALRVPGGYDFPVGVVILDPQQATIRLTNGEEYTVPRENVMELLGDV